MSFVTAPYVQGNIEPIKRILDSFNVNISLKPVLNWGIFLQKPKDRMAKWQRKEVIYSIPFKKYSGQTKHQFGTLLNVYQKTVFFTKKTHNKTKKPLLCRSTWPKPTKRLRWKIPELLPPTRLIIKEVVWNSGISTVSPAQLNRDDCGLLPEAHFSSY